MPHVDEGTLHAYLDGAIDALAEAHALPPGVTRASVDAHLAACRECRALLDAERDVRERAGIVLQHAAPPFAEAPAFEHVVPGRRRRGVPLAWAATIMLAAGAGWWGRELYDTPAMQQVTQQAPAPEAQVAPAVTEEAAPPPSLTPQVAQSTRSAAGAGVAADAAVAAPERAEMVQREEQAVTEPVASVAAAPAPPSAEGSGAAAERRLAASPPPPAPMAQSFAGGTAQAGVQGVLEATRSDTVQWHALAGSAAQLAARDALHLPGGSEPELSTAAFIGYTVVRTQQRIDGERVDIVTVQPSALRLDAIIVTGADARSSAKPESEPMRRESTVQVTATRMLAGGVAEVQLRMPDDGRLVAVRGRLPLERLELFARTLVPLP